MSWKRVVFGSALAAVCLLGAAVAQPGVAPDAMGGIRASADTAYSAAYAAEKVLDGRIHEPEGNWFSADWTPLPCALTLELPQTEAVKSVVLRQAVWSGNMYHTKDLEIDASEDGQEWQRVGAGQMPDESAASVEVPLGGCRARWLRIRVLTSYNPQQTCGLSEVTVRVDGYPSFGACAVALNGQPGALSGSVAGLRVAALAEGPQVAVTERPATAVVALGQGDDVRLSVPVGGLAGRVTVTAEAAAGPGASVAIALGDLPLRWREAEPGGAVVRAEADVAGDAVLTLASKGTRDGASIRWSSVRLTAREREFAVPLVLESPIEGAGPPAVLPPLLPAIEQALIEWDWACQDGIGTERCPATYNEAIRQTIARGDSLLRDLRSRGASTGDVTRRWEAVRSRLAELDGTDPMGPGARNLWLEVHAARRQMALSNPLADVGPLLFVKQVPGAFSHQLTQYYGRYARPGGGVFVLDEPGRSMSCRQLAAGALPEGSYQHPEVSFDGKRVLFAFCATESAPADSFAGNAGLFYHLYEMAVDGSGLRQLTDGAFDDFSPRYLPDGRLVFISTRRLGWHRCGTPGCENYTLAVAESDGSNARPVSYHETQEWDPAVLDDGRIVYTRWDYVDRHAVFYEQLWSTLPDGSLPSAFYGNNTFNPVGVWEPRQVPGSPRIMATAAPHHGMTAGSIVLVDVGYGVDGEAPITRLTPDALFPESENTLAAGWRADIPGLSVEAPVEEQRWPGHCYRSPYPLSEDYFLAAYSYDRLIGEPSPNPRNMFGLYLVDRWGNKELLYRDPNIASVWPVPIRPRPRPPVLVSGATGNGKGTGTILIQDIYESAPAIPRDAVRSLRVVQLVPKSTPGANNPPVGLANASPGKQVLGTVPVEPDGSAWFEAPAGVPLSFQALDERGMALQVMRSDTYLQPGQSMSCVGCHEPRTTAPPNRSLRALSRAPSTIAPGPDGSRPLSYPILVQPVLDKHCVSCHSGEQPGGGVALTAQPEGHYTVSYNALAPRVSISQWGVGDFRRANSEPLAAPLFFGAHGSPLARLLLDGHQGVSLDGEDWDRLVTWMDANALFYGTFGFEDQARQRRGERIEGPELE